MDNEINKDLAKMYEEYKAIKKEKLKTVKEGGDVIHLHYYKSLFNEKDFDDYEKKLGNVDLRFSRYDQSGDMRAYLDDYILHTFLMLNDATINAIRTGLLSSATWDAIKYVISRITQRIKNKTVFKVSTSDYKRTGLNFGIKVQIDDNTTLDFELLNETDQEIKIKSLDLIKEVIKNKLPNSSYKLPNFLHYNKDLDKWINIDVEEELSKKNDKIRAKKKKKK